MGILQEHISLMDNVNDTRLLEIAIQRMKKFDINTTISADILQHELGITDEELNKMDEIEIELE